MAFNFTNAHCHKQSDVTDSIKFFYVQMSGVTFAEGWYDELRTLASLEYVTTSYVDDEHEIVEAIEAETFVISNDAWVDPGGGKGKTKP